MKKIKITRQWNTLGYYRKPSVAFNFEKGEYIPIKHICKCCSDESPSEFCSTIQSSME